MYKYLLTILYLALLIGLLYQPISAAQHFDEEIIEKHRPSLKYQKEQQRQDSIKAELFKEQEDNRFTVR